MKKYNLWATVIVIVALHGDYPAFAQEANEISAEMKIKALEEKLNNLEHKQKLLEQQLEAKKRAAVAEVNSVQTEKLNELEQRQKVVERQLEIEREAAAEKAKAAPIVTANAREGFSIKNPDDSFKLRLRGYVQADSRSVSGNEGSTSTNDDTFLLRRVRPIFEGTVFKDVDFRIMPDFGSGKTELQDAWFDFKYFPEARLQVGKFKTPFGIERLQSGTDTLFIERGLPNNLVPNRDIGAALHSDLFGGKFSYALGIFNGVADGASLDSDVDNNKEFAGRIFVNPWKGGDNPILDGLGVGFAATLGNKDGTSSSTYLASYKTPGQQTFYSYRSGVFADGQALRYSPQAYYSYGSFGLLTEYVTSSQEVTLGANSDKLTNTGWQVAASYVLTGEAASYKSVIPKEVFNPATGTWGAFEVVGRYGQLDVDEDAFPIYVNSATSAKSATAAGGGLNWYWNRNVKWMLDYERTTFDGGDGGQNRATENAVLARVQVTF